MNELIKFFDLNEQKNKVGIPGENNFLSYYEQFALRKRSDHSYDFDMVYYGEKYGIELKTDTYNMADYYSKSEHKSECFFIEKFSSKATQSPGGLWKATNDGVDIFVYHFEKQKYWFWFWMDDIFSKIKLIEHQYNLSDVFNLGYITQGYYIPRKKILDLMEKPVMQLQFSDSNPPIVYVH